MKRYSTPSDTVVTLVSGNQAIPQKATKRTKPESLSNAGILLWPRQSLIGDQSQSGWVTTSVRRVLCFLRFLLWTTEWLRFRNTRTGLFAVALSLAGFTRVFGQPVITQQPQNQTNLAGTTASFTVAATGAEPLGYQWRSYVAAGTTFTNIPLATETTLVLTNVQPTTRRFAVVVTDSGGLSATSSPPATLTVFAPPSIASQPTDQIVDAGSKVTFMVTATGTSPLAYQWRFNDANLADKTSRSLVLANVQLPNAGNYSVVVTNAFGSVTSRVAVLTFTMAHRIDKITANSDRTISLSLTGLVATPFAPYYDLYPLEVSTNLVDWSPLAMLQRTNDSSDALSYRDSDATNFDQRFYRTPTNFFPTPFPKPSGPYPVGTISRLMTDPSRTNRYNIPTNSSFMVTFWYPAQARAGVLPEAWLEQKLIEVDPSYWSAKPASALVQLKSHALPGVPLATNETRYPVVLYSNSGYTRRQNTDKTLELASHGYVVVAMDYPWILVSVFPNGQVVSGSGFGFCANTRACYQPTLEAGIKDLQFVSDELSRFNTNDVLFAGRLDLKRLGIFGASNGCTIAAEFGRIDARCKAVVLFDVGPSLDSAPEVTQFGLQKPFLSMNSEDPGGRPSTDDPTNDPPWLDASLALLAKATNDAFWLQIQGARHQSFADKGSLINDPTLMGDPTSASRAQSQTIRACTVSFFGKYLKGEDNHLLDNPAAVYPNIINFQSK